MFDNGKSVTKELATLDHSYHIPDCGDNVEVQTVKVKVKSVTSSVSVGGQERTWSRIGSLDDRLEYSGQIWMLEGVSRLKCSVECTIDASCESLFYNSQLSKCVALSKQPEDFNFLVSEPGYSFYHNRPANCPSTYSYRDSVQLCFKINYIARTRANAQAACNSDGGHLIRVDTEAKQNYIRSVLQAAGSSHMYIDASDELTEGVFLWGDGRPVNYSDWFSSEPNNEDGVENCVMLANVNYEWYDVPCHSSKAYICEISV
ncbi:ladderlectin-like [Ylistrum balloti]|uniref:ladderlectin-like n=1 Tax=Ylistrum balloti TaxID=509963 RepID=UPI002905E61F|nr:ladderlectin-like [Ylistrum balloti]